MFSVKCLVEEIYLKALCTVQKEAYFGQVYFNDCSKLVRVISQLCYLSAHNYSKGRMTTSNCPIDITGKFVYNAIFLNYQGF